MISYKNITFLLSLFFVTSIVFAQTELNQLDDNGKRHGVWKKYFPDTKQLRYEGEFSHGKEIGTFKFYCEKCKEQPSIVKVFNVENYIAEVTYFAENGKEISAGKMNGKNRIDIWLYYHKNGKSIMVEENYKNGLLDGKITTFYPNGGLTETIMYSEGKKEGENLYYSPASIVIKRLNNTNNMLHGPAYYYDAHGNVIIEGTYKLDAKHGLWKYYQNGKLVKEETYPKPRKKKDN